jgi:hypothetical protein
MEGGEMTKIERSIVIDRAVDDVFEFIHDPTNDAVWQTTLLESTPLDEGPIDVGMMVREVRRFLGVRLELTREITDYEPTATSAFRVVSGPVPMSGAYELEAVDGTTKLTAKGDIEARGFFRVARPAFAKMADRELEASLGHLKDLLEAGRKPF